MATVQKDIYCNNLHLPAFKFANAKRVLFLVDTRNLGEQAEQEFMAYVPNDDNGSSPSL
jgi:type I site-specific restriction endonuclease